jgi:dTMP kinase
MNPGRGRFLSFEGVDGAGKSTLLAALQDPLRARLSAQGRSLVLTREPGGTPLGEALRERVLREPMDPLSETLLVFAARREHVVQVIGPALARGDWVLSDRFTDASFAYQGGARGVGRERIEALAQWVQDGITPDLTVLIDVAPQVAAERRARARAADRFEAEPERFFLAVRDAYLARAAAEPGRFLVLDGSVPVEQSLDAVLGRLQAWT